MPGPRCWPASAPSGVQVNSHRTTDYTFEGDVRRVVYRGTDYELTCRTGTEDIRAVVSAVDWGGGITEGSRVRLGFNSADLRIFPGSQEKELVQYTTESA